MATVKGRFFTSDECLSREHLAVIGKAFQDLTFEMDNKTFIEYCGKKYEVLGVVGIADESSLDHLLFVNLGSMTPEEQIHGRLYVDGNTSMENIISEIDKNAIVLFGDSRIELSFINDKYKRDFERDDFESFKRDVHRMDAIVDDIDEYTVDLRNSKKRIDKIQKLLGLFKEKD